MSISAAYTSSRQRAVCSGQEFKQTHLARELLNADRDAVGLGAVLDGEVADAVLDEVAKEEADDLLVVGSDAEVLPVEREGCCQQAELGKERSQRT